MSYESEEPCQQLTPPGPASRSVRLSEEQAVVLVEGLGTVIDYLWADELGDYQTIADDQRAGHTFEHLMRLKAVANGVRHQLLGDDSPCGTCPHCHGGDGRYVLEEASWGYCRLCHVRWLLGPYEERDTLWPVATGASARLIHELFQSATPSTDFG